MFVFILGSVGGGAGMGWMLTSFEGMGGGCKKSTS